MREPTAVLYPFRSHREHEGVERNGGSLVNDLLNEFPSVPHEAAGVDCCGCIVSVVQGNDVELRCNECGAVVGVVNVGVLTDLVSLIPAR